MLGDYDRFMTSTAERSVYQLEMYEKSPCDVPAGARVAFLDDGNIVYALRVGAELKFFPQRCKRSGQ
ncbi:putative membrane domain protein [Burkholderia pseudomallei NCTC 13179]|nr:putative membrane domain protein [Burkholderia pseudomallei NCTC 13179]